MSNHTPPASTTGQPSEIATVIAGTAALPLRVELWGFAGLLVLALIGAGLNEDDATSRWIYWSALVVVYGGVSIGLTWLRTRNQGLPTWTRLRDEVLHWLGALVAIKIVLLFELEDITARGAAADMSLVLLALSTFSAGARFHWVYLPLGIILAVTAIGVGFLDQYSLYLVILPLAVVSFFLLFWLRKRAHA